MSFNIKYFFLDRGNLYSVATLGMPAMHRYGSPDDDMTTIATTGYFDALIPPQDLPPQPLISGGLNENYIDVGDYILATDNTKETTFLQITQVTPTVIVTQSAVDIPDGSITTAKLANLAVTTAKIANSAITDTQIATNAVTLAKLGPDVSLSGTLSGTFSGPFASPIAAIIDYALITEGILVHIPVTTGTSTTGAIMTFSAALPSGFRPAQDTLALVPVTDNSGAAVGCAKVTTAGVITVGVTAALSAFQNTGTAGVSSSTFMLSII